MSGSPAGAPPAGWDVQVLPVGPLQMNAVVVRGVGPRGLESLVIDPGEEPERLWRAATADGAQVAALAATHGHFDHVGAAADLQDRCGLPLLCHPDDLATIQALPRAQAAYGFAPSRVPRCEPSLQDGAVLSFCGARIQVRHVPGHCPGHVMFLLPDRAVVGDCVFYGSIGRTDLPGGDFGALQKSIRERIYTLPDDTLLICGHGPDTTVGREKRGNPFVRG